jgi:uncharacterized protein
MNSCLYKCNVMHNRLEPKKHSFHYGIFMFCLDLDEIELLSRKFRLMSRNRFNLFSFRDNDHLQWPEAVASRSTVKERITSYLKQQGVDIGKGRIMLVTHLRTLGYIFNPVSFYYCFDEAGQPLCAVVEVCNTFREMKVYFIGKDQLKDGKFHLNTKKYFYVSPFVELDTNFDFNLNIPGEKLSVRIDDFKEDRRFFISTLKGEKKTLSDANLLFYFFRFPLITLRVIFLIHWEALKLWVKRIPYHAKAANIHLQKEILNPKNH